ncbi:MAG: Rne/Rng family ribonuclease [Clostridia bacterium]|nr:Rne/Rng family ribonuclease [Clostridia bacterium]
MRTICVKGGRRQEIAVAEDGKLVEYLCDTQSGSAEGICLGRVERVVTGMKAAFVDIGQEKNGFLPLEENTLTGSFAKLLSGDRVLVQIKKAAQGVKGAFLTRDISLCGEYVLFMPMNRHVGVSSRIEDEAIRNGLKQLGREIAQERFGLVLRSSAASADPEEIRRETDMLAEQWHNVEAAAPTAHAPSLIYQPRTLLDSVVDDYRFRGIDAAVTDDPAVARSLEGVCPVRLTQEDPMVSMDLIRHRDKALNRHVWLDSGGTLVIDRCEAMTVIDVNTAKFTGKKNLEETILRLNLEACGEIARQLRLRNLSGIILLDMIDMKDEAHRAQVLERLKECLASDRIKTVVHGFTSLGLIEMTRKKSRQPLADDWTEICPRCHATGRVIKEEHHG